MILYVRFGDESVEYAAAQLVVMPIYVAQKNTAAALKIARNVQRIYKYRLGDKDSKYLEITKTIKSMTD